MNEKIWPIAIAIIAVLIAGVALFQPGLGGQIETLGVTNLDSLHLSDNGGTATPVLLVNQDGTGVIVEFRDASTPVAQWLDGGAFQLGAGGLVDLNGVADALVLDADADTTISAPTDDQIDIEINGADDFRFLVNSFEAQTGSVVDLNGVQLTVDADADTTLIASSDDIISVTLGAATGRVDLLTGNLSVGNGSPTLTLDGEDAYVEGTFEVDGQAQLDGGLDLNASTLTIDADADTTLVASIDDIITVTLGAATGRVDLLTGNLRVGNGAPTLTQDGEDGYVEGTFEVDGQTQFDGGLDLNASTLTIDADADTTLVASIDDIITVTLGAATGRVDLLTGNFRVGNGSPTLTQDGEDGYVEGTFEVDGQSQFDGGIDLNASTLTIDADADTTLVSSIDDIITMTLGAATGRLDLLTGNFRVGNGAPTLTQDGEDAYVEGIFEVDGQTQLDGGLDLNASTLTIDADADTTLVASIDDIITITLGATTGRVDLLTGNLRVGNGTPGTAQDGEDAYVEGGLEVDGTTKLDGTVDAAADVDIGTWLNLSAQAFTLVADEPITPTRTYVVVTSAVTVTTSTASAIADGSEAGDLLIIRNGNAFDTITIDGTGANVECKTDKALVGGDTLTLIWNGSDWNCLATHDNS